MDNKIALDKVAAGAGMFVLSVFAGIGIGTVGAWILGNWLICYLR